ncbi:MAG: peptidase [Herminiimonas sp.]|nr:peptidase [Herminiimonas sp.]
MTFNKLRTRAIPAMNAVVQEYEDPASGARHIHLATDSPELVFLVGFPTVPDASDGRAHILEHLALCGSARYPVRDPFFSMLRRSTAHFMNAMTYADKTVYPFASTDKTDFFNLLDVYLDAAFFPRLDYLDFLQEGWRLALDGDKLAYHGVVFNEMKGAFSDPVRALSSGISACLLKGTTYEFESGGDPLEIPSLTHAALVEFHATHYHPSQAVFMTAGQIDPLEIQAVIEQRVLSKLHGRTPRMLPQFASSWSAPQAVTINIPGQEHGVQIAWLLGESVDPEAYYCAQLLEAGLLSNASAPLAHAMESAGYGRPSAMNGADADGRQIVFHLGMEGLTREQVGPARKRIWSALEKAARTGVPESLLQATLRDIRFGQREISGGGTPDALKRLLRAMPHEMYGGDIMNGFAAEDIIEKLQERIADPAFFKGLVQTLLDSTTRLDASVVPDADYFQKRQASEDERLASMTTSLTQAEKERLQADAAMLLDRQRQPVDNDVLPRVRPRDVSPLPRPAFPLPRSPDGVIPVSIPSNGISYARVMYEVSHLEQDAWPWLQLYVDVLPELGVGEKTYDEADAWRHDRVPFFDVNLNVLQTQDDTVSLRIHVDFYAKGLREQNHAVADVLSNSVRAARFDEHERLAFLIDSMVQDMRNGLADEGDNYARLSATAPLSPTLRFEEHVKGTTALAFYNSLQEMTQTEKGLEEISRKLTRLHQRIIGTLPTIITAGMEEDGRELADMLALPVPAITVKEPPPAMQAPAFSNAALHAPAQVNHCFAAWAAPGLAHPDAPALSVLGEILTNLVLHQALREEGGAYGGQAGYNPAAGTFVMMSYRDPRLAETYADFKRAISWVIEAELEQENIEEAIICVVQDLDKPRTPYAQVMWTWDQQSRGITDEMRQQFRYGVLQCSSVQIKAAAAAWLKDKPFSRAAFVGSTDQALAGLEVTNLM